MLDVITELIDNGLSDQEIADELSPSSKADLIGAIRTCAEEFVHKDDVDGLLTRLEDLAGGVFRALLDERMKPETSEGDYLVAQKEIHEQLCLVHSDVADSEEEAAQVVKETGGSLLYGTSDFDRMPTDFDYAVSKIGEDKVQAEYFNVGEV
jgi:hypothetical protein